MVQNFKTALREIQLIITLLFLQEKCYQQFIKIPVDFSDDFEEVLGESF